MEDPDRCPQVLYRGVLKQMAQEISQKEFGGYSIKFKQLEIKKSRAVWVRVVKLLSGPVGELIRGFHGLGSIGDLDIGSAANAIQKLPEVLSEADLDFLCDTFASSCKVTLAETGAEVPLGPLADTIFAGQLMLQFQWLWWCLSENYADFLSVFKILQIKALAVKAPSRSTSPVT